MSIVPQIASLLQGEEDLVASIINVCAAFALKEQFNWFWVGFYMVKKDELVLALFQGPDAFTLIKIDGGFCRATW